MNRVRRGLPDLVTVLGAGISGLSTAITLELRGVSTKIISAEFPRSAGSLRNPWVPTDFAMASVYPHHVPAENERELHLATQEMFRRLEERGAPGVGRVKLFEVFESEQGPAPEYSELRPGFMMFGGEADEIEKQFGAPRRPGARELFGWSFETFFADMPPYLAFLREWYASLGGTIETAGVTGSLIEDLPGDTVVNCLGIGALELFEDHSPVRILRGRQVLVPNLPPRPAAYNYTPSAEVFSRANGEPEYVHFFPRSDGWLLGQTREPGKRNEDGDWEGSAVLGEEIKIGHVSIPAAIVELNRELLRRWLGAELPAENLRGFSGYRFYRDDGIRLDTEEYCGKTVIHNYGHAGSGVTVSWGCAERTAQNVLKVEEGSATRPAELPRTFR